MTWIPILDALSSLGQATWHSLWVPLLMWTAIALPVWALLDHLRLHPLAQYRLRQVLLGALPLGIAVAAVVDVAGWLPAMSRVQETAGTIGIGSPMSVSEAAHPPTGPSWTWMHAVGLASLGALIGALLGLGRLSADIWAFARLRRFDTAEPTPSLRAQMETLQHEMQLRRAVRVATTEKHTGPMTLAGWPATVLLPAGFTDRPDAREMVLRHEFVHIRRWDDVAHFFERFVAALLLAIPHVELLRQSIARYREQACDAAVLEDNRASAASYARLLAAFADQASPVQRRVLSLSESPSSLKDRLKAMQSPMSRLLSSRLGRGAVTGFLALLLTVGIVACSDAVGPSSTPATDAGPTSESMAALADSTVFMVVQDKPELKGGMERLQNSLEYPEVARKAGLEGRVIVQFVVGRDGQVHDPEVIRGIHKILDQAAIETVKAQTFEPGRQNGQPVPVRMALPVIFDLSNSSSDAEPTGSVGARDNGTIETADHPQKEKVADDLSPRRPPGLRMSGGLEALSDEIHYPEFARKAGIEGTVLVRFQVDENGHVQNPSVAQGVHDLLNEEALRAIQEMSFEPVETVGGPTTAEMTLPVSFRLPNDPVQN